MPKNEDETRSVLAGLLQQLRVLRLLDAIREDHDATTEEQCRIALIEAPPREEAKRALYMSGRFKQEGLAEAVVDGHGNAVAMLKGAAGGQCVLIEAHLDTVFPFGSVREIVRSGDRIEAPGIGDNCRGLAALLSIIKAISKTGLSFERDIVFAATAGEEGIGDLAGMRGLIDSLATNCACSLSIDGHGKGDFVFDATGSRRYEVTFTGQGGHSWTDFGTASAVHAMGRAVANISAIEVPREPKTTFNVGLISGGTSVNSIAQAAVMTVDLRSSAKEQIDIIERQFRQAVQLACEDEMKAASVKSEIKATYRKVGDRPAGRGAEDSGMETAAKASCELLKIDFVREASSSTNANIPISMGIPALCMGGGGDGGGTHTMQEWFVPADGWKAVQNAALLLVYFAGLAGS